MTPVTPVTPSLSSQRLVAVFCGGLLLLNFPLLGLWDVRAELWGWPVFPLALFLMWALLIGVLAWLMEFRAPDAQDD